MDRCPKCERGYLFTLPSEEVRRRAEAGADITGRYDTCSVDDLVVFHEEETLVDKVTRTLNI